MSTRTIGIDLGATKVHIGVVQDSRVVNEIQFPTLASSSKEDIISRIIQGIEKVGEDDFDGIGLGVPGLVDEEKGVIFDVFNIPSWQEVHIKENLEKHFNKPVRITNDANIFALGEQFYGKGSGYQNMVGMTLGSGLGTGIIIDHKLYSGSYSSAGELGLIPYLGKTLEDYCSGKFFIQEYNLKGEEVFHLAQQGDPLALKIYAEFGSHLGHALNIIMMVLSPQAVFFGGSIAGAFEFFEGSLRSSLQDFPFKRVLNELVLAPSKTSNISILGAAALITSQRIAGNLILNAPQP